MNRYSPELINEMIIALEFYADRDTWRGELINPRTNERGRPACADDVDGDFVATYGKWARAVVARIHAEESKTE